jgi:type IV secretion system protein TrbI
LSVQNSFLRDGPSAGAGHECGRSVRCAAPAPQPDLSIRARPPSPKRLSRKVLLGGAITLAAIVSAALLFGLSAQPNRFGREADAQATAGGPPETIQSAPADYASADLGGGLAEDHGVDPL